MNGKLARGMILSFGLGAACTLLAFWLSDDFHGHQGVPVADIKDAIEEVNGFREHAIAGIEGSDTAIILDAAFGLSTIPFMEIILEAEGVL